MAHSCVGHSHDHQHDDESGISLRPYIDIPNVYCLNEHEANAGASILKTYSDRFQPHPVLLSQPCTDTEDEYPVELLMFIPFTEMVSIQSISVCGTVSSITAPPHNLKVFVNRTDLDFESARDLDPAMNLELVPPEHVLGEAVTLDYPLRPAGRFQSCSSITLYFEDNYGFYRGASNDDSVTRTEITYIGFKGRGTNVKRVAVEAVYETRGMKQDHQVPEGDLTARHGFLS